MDKDPPEEFFLRDTVEGDLESFYQHQLNQEANRMAAFTRQDPTDQDAFMAHWHKILADENLPCRTIIFRDQVAGYVLAHGWFGDPEVSYWIDRRFWGQGLATRALTAFLETYATRPLYAHVAHDNLGSLRVLEKCGFRVVDENKGFSHARGEDTRELILELSSGVSGRQ